MRRSTHRVLRGAGAVVIGLLLFGCVGNDLGERRLDPTPSEAGMLYWGRYRTASATGASRIAWEGRKFATYIEAQDDVDHYNARHLGGRRIAYVTYEYSPSR